MCVLENTVFACVFMNIFRFFEALEKGAFTCSAWLAFSARFSKSIAKGTVWKRLFLCTCFVLFCFCKQHEQNKRSFFILKVFLEKAVGFFEEKTLC